MTTFRFCCFAADLSCFFDFFDKDPFGQLFLVPLTVLTTALAISTGLCSHLDGDALVDDEWLLGASTISLPEWDSGYIDEELEGNEEIEEMCGVADSRLLAE